MSGLDKMKSRIFEEAEQSAAELLDQAKKDAEKIVKDAVEKAGADAEHIRVKAAADAKEYAKRAESSADMNRKQALLAAKQDVIRSVLEDAYSQVMNMDDAAVTYSGRMIRRQTEISLSRSTRERLVLRRLHRKRQDSRSRLYPQCLRQA